MTMLLQGGSLGCSAEASRAAFVAIHLVRNRIEQSFGFWKQG